MKKYKVVIGIELETEYSPRVLGRLDLNSHHADYGWCKFLDNKYFKCESDGSLRARKFNNTVEIISAPIELDKVQKVLKSFQKSIFKKAGKTVPFNKIFEINNTCGCHIHISVLDPNNKYRYEIYDGGREEVFDFPGKPYNIKEILSEDFMDVFRAKLHKTIKKNLNSIYPSFSKNYFRTYTLQIDENVQRGDRYVEYYFATNERCEYRSFNLIGVKTWEEFFSMFKLFGKTLQKTLDTYEKKVPIPVKEKVITHTARINNV